MVFTKRSKITILLFALSLITILLGVSACGQQAVTNDSLSIGNDPSGTVASGPLTVLSMTGGDVFIMEPGGNKWVKAEEGINLRVDNKIRTGANSHATVTFFEGSTIDLDGDTEITLSELGFSPDSSITNIQIKQEVGATMNRVKKLVDLKSRYDVETPSAVAAVRGTTFFVKVGRDGETFVGNVKGLVGVVAQGVEVSVTQGSHVVVVPGKSPGPVEPGAMPSPSTVPTTAPSETVISPVPNSPLPEGTPKTSLAKIAIEQIADRQAAFPGDTIAYTYNVKNTGAVPLKNISITSDRGNGTVFTSGDSNSNNILDAGEIWIFNANYLIQAGESAPVTNTATASGVDPDNANVSASAAATVNITRIVVKITGVQVGDIVSRAFSLSGTVNDPSITQATISVNNANNAVIDIKNGEYHASVTLVDGENQITVSVTKPGGVAVSESVYLVPSAAP
jgi:uncharacterized repeat protein (TIGR01451 family)